MNEAAPFAHLLSKVTGWVNLTAFVVFVAAALPAALATQLGGDATGWLPLVPMIATFSVGSFCVAVAFGVVADLIEDPVATAGVALALAVALVLGAAAGWLTPHMVEFLQVGPGSA